MTSLVHSFKHKLRRILAAMAPNNQPGKDASHAVST